MRSWNGVFTIAIALGVGAAACGGSTTTATVGPSEAGSDDGTTSASSSSGSGSSGSSGSSGGADGTAPPDDDGGGDGSLLITGGSSSGSSSTDAMASSSGAMPGDGGPNQIACGGTPCDSATQVCCATRAGRMCVATGTCTGESLACSGSNSCTAGSGEVCCEQLTATGTIRTRCDTACPAGARQLCTTKADCKPDQDCRRGVDGYGACVVAADRDAAAD